MSKCLLLLVAINALSKIDVYYVYYVNIDDIVNSAYKKLR